MAVLQTKLNPRAEDFKANATAMRALSPLPPRSAAP